MSIKLTITVADITATLNAGYTKIKVYRSSEQTTDFIEITTPQSYVNLVSGQSVYEFVDSGGNTALWYRTTFYNPSVPAESGFSASFLGTFHDPGFATISYPPEYYPTNDDQLVIDKVRTLIGDKKELVRDYVSVSTGYTNVSEDGTTYALSSPKGWPLSVKLNNQLYTSKYEPTVNGYQFITFSGTTISTVSGTLDVWYYNFRNSDAEIMRVYNALIPPAPLTADQVTFELALICTAIELLSAELRGSSSSSGLEIEIYEEIRINPKIGLDSRMKDLMNLMKQRDAIIDEIIEADAEEITGVLID